MAQTARWGHRYPALADAGDVPLWMQRLAEDLEPVAHDTQGLLAARPPAATAKYGAYYFATDTVQLFRSDGSNWIEIPVGVSVQAEIGDYKMSAQPADHGSLGGGRNRWLTCDARAMLRTDYPLLWDLFRQGTSNSPFGNGNGTTTFNLPDIRGRIPVSAGAGPGLTSRLLGASGGEETHTLGPSEMPAHSHGIHEQFGPAGGISGLTFLNQNGNQFDGYLATEIAGASGPHNNMQPYLVAGYRFIKAA